MFKLSPELVCGRRLAATARGLLSAALLCIAGTALAQSAQGGGARPPTLNDMPPLPVVQVGPGVFVHFGALQEWQPRNAGDVANLGFVIGKRCVAVIDSGGTPQVGHRLLAAIRQATPLPVCYVINTHAHPDHMLGNVAFVGLPGAPAQFVGSARLGAALAARERHYLNALQRDFGMALSRESIVHPQLAVETVLELDLGGRVLQLNAWPTAHTDHDLTVHDRQTRTLFLGDLLFATHLPVLDGKLRGWLEVMNSLQTFDVTLAVPGHGAASAQWPAAMAAQRNYLTSLLVQTKAAIAAKMTIQQAVDSLAPPTDVNWQLTEAFHRRNVTAAYAELEWDD